MKHPITSHIKWALSDWWRNVIRAKNRIQYHMNGGYPCHCCGELIPIHYTDLDAFVNGKRMMISSYGKHLYCPSCLLKKIETYFDRVDVFPEYSYEATNASYKGTCDWFGKDQVIIDTIMQYRNPIAEELDLDVRFGSCWWNGHHACKQAFRECLTSPTLKYRTGVIGMTGNEFYHIDRNGILLPDKGMWK